MAELRICGQVSQRHGGKIITAWDRIRKGKLKASKREPGLPLGGRA